MSFLLSSFFAVPVSSMLGFLSLRLCWVFFAFRFYRGRFCQFGLLLCLASSLRRRAEVVSARSNPSHGTIDVRGMCNFLGSVSSQQKFEATDVKALGVSQLLDSVAAQFYLENKGKYILEV